MMLRPSFRLLSRACRTALRQNSRLVPRTFVYPSTRWFSKDEEPTATVTFTDQEEHEKQSSGDTTGINVSEFTEQVRITMPDMGESTAKVVKWYKQEGDLVKRNDVLCDIQTEDFTFGLTVDDEEDGIMGTIAVPENSESNIDDGDLLCIVLHRSEAKGEEQKDGSSDSTE